MANQLRIVADNAVDRGTLSAGSATLPATNMATNNKSEVWRAASVTSTSVSVSFTSTETVNFVSLFGNFSPTCTVVVKCYSDTAGSSLIYTHPSTLWSKASAIKVAGLTLAQSASAYAYGGGSVGRVYFPSKSVRKITIDIVDTNNLQGYLEAYKMIVGEYFEPVYGAEYGVSLCMEDLSKNYRSDAGNLHTDVGARYKKLTANLSVLPIADRAAVWKIVSYCGLSNPVFVSVFPENEDADLEQAHTVFGKFSSTSVMVARDYAIYSTPLEIEGI